VDVQAERVSDNASGVRRLGFGVSGPHSSPMISPRDTEEMIDAAFALGVRLFDTGPSYGNGEAERRLGLALQRLPRYDCIVSTKAGIRASGARPVRDFSPDGVRRSIEGSLKRLHVQRLDWLFLHGPAAPELTDGLLNVLAEARSDGTVGMLGIAGRGPEIDAAMATGLFGVFMAPVHAGLAPYQIDRLKRLKATGAELIAFETLMPTLPRLPAPTSPGATWRMMKWLAGRAKETSQVRKSAADSLLWALNEGGAHRVLTTTSRLSHLEENVAAVRNAPLAE
jgi:aryl-alcohol dehydrogenase-like predicted oxidoreductase